MNETQKVLCATALFIILSSTTNAALVTVNWLEEITRSDILGAVDLGDTVMGGFSYDDTAKRRKIV